MVEKVAAVLHPEDYTLEEVGGGAGGEAGAGAGGAGGAPGLAGEHGAHRQHEAPEDLPAAPACAPRVHRGRQGLPVPRRERTPQPSFVCSLGAYTCTAAQVCARGGGAALGDLGELMASSHASCRSTGLALLLIEESSTTFFHFCFPVQNSREAKLIARCCLAMHTLARCL